MSDDKSSVGKPDRDQVSGEEAYEVEYLATKFGVTPEVVREAIAAAGPMRVDVEAKLAHKHKRDC